MTRLAAAGLAAMAALAAFPLGAGAETSAALDAGQARPFATEAIERVVIGRSVRGRKIVATRVGDPDGERIALAVGVTHGDERGGVAQHLGQGPGSGGYDGNAGGHGL